MVGSLDIKEDGCLKTEIRLNEDAMRPEKATELDRQSWWAGPPLLALLCMTSKLQGRTPKSVQRGNYGHKITENYVSEGSPPELIETTHNIKLEKIKKGKNLQTKPSRTN